MKYRFREIPVSDGTVLDIPSDARSITIQIDRTREMMTRVAWLEIKGLEIE